MKKFLLSVFMAAFTLQLVSAQSAKTTPPPKAPAPTTEQLKLKPWPRKSSVPPAENPFGLPRANYQPIGPLAAPGQPAADAVETVRGENGLPIFFRGSTDVSQNADASRPVGARALDYLASLQPVGIAQPAQEFVVRSSTQDEQGNWHVRLDQVFQGVSVYGGELIAHTKNGVFELLNGRYFPTPRVASMTPSVSAETAVQRVVQQLGSVKTDWNDEDRQLVGGKETQAELVVYHHRHHLDAERLAWHVVIYPDLMHRKVFFVDAATGEIIHHFDHTCSIGGGDRCEGHAHPTAPPALVSGPVTASGLDLKNVNRSFGAWMDGVTNYLEDAGQPMFNAGASQMPSSPVGAIITLNAENTSPEVQSTFKYSLVSSGTLVFGNKNAVSTHWNAIQSYKYFLGTHGRNSIDGNGGNIISLFNVSESDGTSMGNAFWNGAAMWYGNGDATFFELARGLDVGGHELTHGVIEKTANLEYQYESGALNESFADVFAVCIDTLNWKIGEDVVKPGATTNNCLRDLQFPNNGTPSQPKQVSEQYQGTQDNGGVHINSGIPNRAFYLFATNPAVGRARAEKVYYKALTDYLVKSSKFVDCRLAVIQAANDLYGGTVANAAATAFTTVGIAGSQGGNYFGTLNQNPGIGLVVCTNNAGDKVNLYRENGTLVGNLYSAPVGTTVISRPSISDDGQQIVFCTSDGDIVGVDLIYSQSTGFDWQSGIVSISPVWRNVAISKDGRFIAALPVGPDNRIYVEDLADILGNSRTFFLYNPTYSTGQATGEVRYADVLEFDYSGEYIMYDAYNELNNGQGEDLSYWDIGFMKFWENGDFTGATPFISKLFSGLPPKSSVANPVFSQTAPFVMAFDFIDGVEDQYHVLGANIQSGDVDYLVYDNGELGWPSYTRADGEVVFQRTTPGGVRNLYQRTVAPNRIQGTGSSAFLVVNGHDWGRWFAIGSRSLMVGTDAADAAALGLVAAPNPTTGAVQLAFALPQAGPVQVIVSDLLGRTVQQSAQNLPEGENRLDLDLNHLPAGTYAVRVLAAGKGATLKVVKQ
ncbi:MAG: M4 family metallopeptidase [Saprospiraceae bacterium]|jgi:Zn-dependent metalloprotease|nr:M4 family metallopeptidase [Saprospiraceae bacterium]